MLKKTLISLTVLFIVLALIVYLVVLKIQGTGPKTGVTELRFREIPFPFIHSGDLDKSLPFMGIAAGDFDGDKIDEIIVSGGKGQSDQIFSYQDTGFVRQNLKGLAKESADATFGLATIDADNDGKDDLFIARESGVYFAQNTGNGFQQTKLEFGMADNTTPLSVAVGDINKDGWADLYISGYIKLEMAEGETNFSEDYGGYSYLLLNNGKNEWMDISRQAGVFRQHNTFLAVFADLNSDSWPDLVVAQDTGKVEIWENLKDNRFKRHKDPTDYGYPMGIGAGDIDNDGDVDLYFSNVGNTLPRQLLVGNLREDQPFNMDYILLRNDGDFQFSDISIEKNAAKYGFGWGTTIADFNNDSRMDLYFSQNYARFPGVKYLSLYPGRLLEQQSDGTFLSVEKSANIKNKNFGISQVFSDFNQDGKLDLVIANLTGPVKAFINEGASSNQGISILMPNTPKWLNTVGVLEFKNGSSLKRQLFQGEGLCSDNSRILHFGLGKLDEISRITLTRPDGKTYVIKDPKAGSFHSVKE